MNRCEWRDVKGYEGLYKVNQNGDVISLKMWNGHEYVSREKPYHMKPSNTSTGYKKVELSKNGERKSHKIHRLVAFAFIENKEGKPIINHKDGNPLNNNVENLEWCTQKENVNHACRTGLKRKNYISREKLLEYVNSGMRKKDIEKITHISPKRLTKFYELYGIRNHFNKFMIPKEEMIKALKSGKRNREIAEMFGCTRQLVATRRYQMKKGIYI